MKILFVLHNTGMEGSLLSFLTLARDLKKMQDVDICTIIPPHLAEDASFCKQADEIGFRVKISPISMSFSSTDWNFKLRDWFRFYKNLLRDKYRSFREIYKIAKSEQPDIIHTNSGAVHEGFWVAKVLKIPHVWHLREYQDLDFHFRVFPSMALFRYELRHSYVITITEDIRKHFKLNNTNKYRAIYNGIYYERQAVLITTKEHYFLCASRLTREKDIMK